MGFFMPLQSLELQRTSRTSGATVIILALVIVAIVGVVGLALDGGMAMRLKTASQTAGDLGALVGAAKLKTTGSTAGAVQAARQIISANLRASGASGAAVGVPSVSISGISSKLFTVTQNLRQRMLFAPALPGVPSSMNLRTQSRASYNTALANANMHWILLVDSSNFMSMAHGPDCGFFCWDQFPATCVPGCLSSMSVAHNLAAQIITQLTSSETLSIVEYRDQQRTVFDWAAMTGANKASATTAVNAINTFLVGDTSLGQYADPAAGFYGVLQQIQKLSTQPQKSVAVIWLLSDAFYLLNSASSAWPRDSSCGSAFEDCETQRVSCYRATGNARTCWLIAALCKRRSSTVNEEQANLFLHQAQLTRSTRVYPVIIGNHAPEKVLDYSTELRLSAQELKELSEEQSIARKWNVYVSLAASTSQPLDSVVSQNRLSCGGAPFTRPTGRLFSVEYFQPAGAPGSVDAVVNQILSEARGRAQSGNYSSAVRLTS